MAEEVKGKAARMMKVQPAEKKKNFDMMKDGIQASPLYKANMERRGKTAPRIIRENCEKIGGSKIVPGQMIYFNYFEPKTREELEYYDATPNCVYFNKITTKEGYPRVLAIPLASATASCRLSTSSSVLCSTRHGMRVLTLRCHTSITSTSSTLLISTTWGSV